MIMLLELVTEAKTSVLTTALGWFLCFVGWLGTASMGLSLADRIAKLEKRGKSDGSGDGS